MKSFIFYLNYPLLLQVIKTALINTEATAKIGQVKATALILKQDTDLGWEKIVLKVAASAKCGQANLNASI